MSFLKQKTMKFFFIFISALVISLSVFGQDRMELIKPNGKRIMSFSPGDRIKFKNIFNEEVKG